MRVTCFDVLHYVQGLVRVMVMVRQKYKEMLGSVSRCCTPVREVDIGPATAELVLFPQQLPLNGCINTHLRNTVFMCK